LISLYFCHTSEPQIWQAPGKPLKTNDKSRPNEWQ